MPRPRSDLADPRPSQPPDRAAAVLVDGKNGLNGKLQRPRPVGHGEGTCADTQPLAPDPEAGDLPQSPRILIVSASMGTGHLRAAEAIELALLQRLPEAKIKTVDVFALAMPQLRWAWPGVYHALMRWAPPILGLLYDFFDGRPNLVERLQKLGAFLDTLQAGRFVRLLQSEPWDLVINTFFFSGNIIARLKRRGRFTAPQVMITTDFETHRGWVTQPCEQYFTATEEAAEYLHVFGVPRGDVRITGIPIHSEFGRPKERSACLARLGLGGDRPVVLLLAGGHGAGPIEGPYRELLQVPIPLEVVVVTGRNEAAKRRLERIPLAPQHRTHILGYTRQMDELLAVADMVVTKPGGLTVSELLARGTPLVIINPVPGQEERNSDFLLANGAAVKVNHHPSLALQITELLRDPDRLARMRASALRLARPQAAFDIVEHSLALIRKPHPTAGRGDR